MKISMGWCIFSTMVAAMAGLAVGIYAVYPRDLVLLSVPNGYSAEFCQGEGFTLKVVGARGNVECLGNPCHTGLWIYDAEGRAVSGMVPGFRDGDPCVTRKEARR